MVHYGYDLTYFDWFHDFNVIGKHGAGHQFFPVAAIIHQYHSTIPKLWGI